MPKLHDHWERFEEDVDDVVPLAVRSIECATEEHVIGNPGAGDEKRAAAELFETSRVNWLEAFSKEKLAQEQRADPDLSILHKWKQVGALPTKEDVALKSPAVRNTGCVGHKLNSIKVFSFIVGKGQEDSVPPYCC